MRPRPSAWRLAPLGLVAAAAIAFIAIGGHHYLTFAALAENRGRLMAFVADRGCAAGAVYIALYAVLTALSVPGGGVLTIAGGVLFGTWLGALCAVIGATLGATAIFLAVRAGLSGLARRAGPLAGRLEAGFRADAFSYLLFLRLVPIFPFWLVNLVPALLGVRLRTFVLGTFIGIIPATFIYAGLGNGLGRVVENARSEHRIPAGRAASARRARRARPDPGGIPALAPQRDRMTRLLAPDLCVIGAGAGGLAVAAGAAQMGAEVVLVERGAMGGDCLNFGCVPSKSLFAAARLAALRRRSPELGIEYSAPQVDFAAVGDSVRRVIARLAPNDSAARFEALGIEVLHAEARFTSPRTVRAGDAEIRPRRFVIATGSHPAVPPIPGLDAVPYLTNETVFANRALPEHLIVIGGGPIGIEMAQAHRRLGARVTVIDVGPLLPRDDPELVAAARRSAHRRRDRLAPASRRSRRSSATAKRLRVRLAGGERIVGSHLLVAAGRRPTVDALDLAGRRDRGQRDGDHRSMRGCARRTGAPSPSAMSRAGRNSPMSRSTTRGS